MRVRHIVAVVMVALLVAAILLLRTGRGVAPILRHLVKDRVTGTVHIGSVRGALPGHIILHDVVVREADGREAVRAETLELRLNVRSLISKHVEIALLHASGLVVHARRLPDGRLNLATLPRESEGTSDTTIDIAALKLDGDADFEGLRGGLHFAGALTLAPETTTVRADTLEAQLVAPGRASLSAAGTLAGDRLRDVVVEARTSDLARLAGDPRLHGDWRARILAHGPLTKLALEADVTPPRGKLHARGELASPKWSFELSGEGVDPAAAFTGAPEMRVALAASGRGEGSRGTIDVTRLVAEAREAKARASGRIDLGSVLGVDGRVHLDAADLRRLHVGDLAGSLHADAHIVHRGERLRADAEVRASSLRAQGATVAALHARVHLDSLTDGRARLEATGVSVRRFVFDRLSARLEAHGQRLQLAVEGAGPASTLKLAAHGRLVRQNAASLTLDELAFSSGDKHLRALAPARVELGPLLAVENLRLAADGQRLTLTGRWDRVTHAVFADARLDLALEHLRTWLPGRFATLGGHVRADLYLSGTTANPDLALHVDGDQLAYEQIHKSRLHAKIAYHARKLQAQLAADIVAARPAGGIELQATVPIDLTNRKLQHTAAIELVAHLNGLVPTALPLEELGLHTPLKAGTFSGSIALSGTLHQPRLTADISANRLAAFGVRGIDATLRADYAGDVARVRLQGDAARAPVLFAEAVTRLPFKKLVDGEPWKLAPVDGTLVVPAWNAAGGTVNAFAEVHGTFAHPWGRLSASAEKIHYGDTRLHRARLEGDFDGKTLSASLWADQPGGGTLRADSAIPLDAARPWNVLISAQKARVALDDVGSLRRLAGQLDGDLSVSGTRAHPLVSGELRLSDGALGIAGDPRLYQNIQAVVAAREDTLEIRKVTMDVGGGKAQASGHVRLGGLLVKSLDVDANLTRLPVAEGPVGAWIDAELHLHGERSGAAAFTGTVTVKKGTAHLPKLAAGRRLQPTGPLKEVVFTDPKARRERARRKAAERDEVPTTALLAARIPGPFHIRSPELMTDLDGELEVEVVGPVTRVTGEVRSSGGWIELLGRRYDLDRVRLGFGGETEIDPELDVRITREISDAVIAIEVRGTAKKPKLVFSSDPPIYDETQIIGIIVSGDPGQSRVSDRSLDQKVVGALSGLIVGKLKDQIAPGLPIDVIKVETGDSGYTGMASTRVELGKYITENIYVSYVHQFGELQIGTRRLNANEANVEWRIRRHFGVSTRFGDAAVGALDFYWTFRY